MRAEWLSRVERSGPTQDIELPTGAESGIRTGWGSWTWPSWDPWSRWPQLQCAITTYVDVRISISMALDSLLRFSWDHGYIGWPRHAFTRRECDRLGGLRWTPDETWQVPRHFPYELAAGRDGGVQPERAKMRACRWFES